MMLHLFSAHEQYSSHEGGRGHIQAAGGPLGAAMGGVRRGCCRGAAARVFLQPLRCDRSALRSTRGPLWGGAIQSDKLLYLSPARTRGGRETGVAWQRHKTYTHTPKLTHTLSCAPACTHAFLSLISELQRSEHARTKPCGPMHQDVASHHPAPSESMPCTNAPCTQSRL